MNASLSPREYKIVTDTPYGYHWFVVYISFFEKWGIRLGNYPEEFRTKSGLYNYAHNDTIMFETPEEALAFWVKMDIKNL